MSARKLRMRALQDEASRWPQALMPRATEGQASDARPLQRRGGRTFEARASLTSSRAISGATISPTKSRTGDLVFEAALSSLFSFKRAPPMKRVAFEDPSLGTCPVIWLNYCNSGNR